MRLILLGPPGAGKGTQANMLSERFSITHISSGDILRHNVNKGTKVGLVAQDFMKKGELVPDEVVIEMILESIKAIKKKSGFILDGFPRTLNQAKQLDYALKDIAQPIDIVVYLKTSLSVILKRLTGRRICKVCGTNYHIINMPPRKEGFCDRCGGALYQREDDKEETISKRLEVYKKEAEGLIEYYNEKRVLRNVSGDLDAPKTFMLLVGILNESSKKYFLTQILADFTRILADTLKVKSA